MERPLFRSRIGSNSQILALLLAAIPFFPLAVHSQGPAQDISCENGNGEYSTKFSTGTTVSLGPLRNGAFAERACVARLFGNGQQVSVASDAAEVVIDVLGADIGFGKPVVAFQIDESGDGKHRSYRIFSLNKPLRLLYTITGASSYAAADTDLDGKIEIWADDAAAIDGFDGVPFKSFDSAPAVALRFEKNRLVDVSAEFLPRYDAQIADLRAQIDPHELAAFQNSDGILSMDIHRPGDELRRLARTKIKVLEIVWAYLYSGRDAQAWSALEDMWPSPDINRVRKALADLRQRGILRGIDRAPEKSNHKHQVHIYDETGTTVAVSQNVLNAAGGAPDTTSYDFPVVQPRSILLHRPPPSEVEDAAVSDAVLELVVDAAGKVRSAKLVKGTDKRWVQASAGWHFIPALRDGSPVACRFRLSVWDMR
jgi:hypothetical protein